MFAGCVTTNHGTQIQGEAFNVLPTYCYGDECFDIQRKTAILLFNNNIPDGEYKIIVEMTTLIHDTQIGEKETAISLAAKGKKANTEKNLAAWTDWTPEQIDQRLNDYYASKGITEEDWNDLDSSDPTTRQAAEQKFYNILPPEQQEEMAELQKEINTEQKFYGILPEAQQVKKCIQTKTINVNGDIVTVEIADFVSQYNQKKQKVTNMIDKSGTLNKKHIKMLENIFNQGLECLPTHASSGDIINFTTPVKFGELSIKMNIDILVHGITTYEGNEYVLLETRGTGKTRISGRKVPVTYGGYTLRDGFMNRDVRSVMDMTIKEKEGYLSLKIIVTEKEI